MKSIPGFRPELRVDQPGGIINEISAITMIMAENKKYQPRLPTISNNLSASAGGLWTISVATSIYFFGAD